MTSSSIASFLSFSSPTLSGPKDTKHKPSHYPVLTPRDDTPANVSCGKASEDPNYSESTEKSVRLEVRGLHLKSAGREKFDERMKFLGLSEPLKTITVKLTTSFLPLLLYGIDGKCDQIQSSSSSCRSMSLFIDSL